MATVATIRPLGQPDIDYAPDLDKYLARTQRRLQTEPLKEATLPEGFPKQLESDFVWEGKDLEGKYQYVYELTEDQVAEVEDGLRYFKCKPKAGCTLSLSVYILTH